MRRLCLLVAFPLVSFLPAHAGHKPPQILMRVYIQTNEGLPPTEARPVQVPPDNEVIQVRTIPELTENQLTAVEADASGAVHLHFDHSGQVDLDAFTAQDQGRIMVVFIDGVIVYAPTIDTQLSNGELILPHPLTPETVRLLQEKAAANNAQEKRT